MLWQNTLEQKTHAFHTPLYQRIARRALRGPLGTVLALCVVGGGYAILSRLLGSGSTNVLDTLRTRGTIVVGVQSDRAPYGQMDDSGTASGFEPELATALCESVLGTGSVQFLGRQSQDGTRTVGAGELRCTVCHGCALMK